MVHGPSLNHEHTYSTTPRSMRFNNIYTDPTIYDASIISVLSRSSCHSFLSVWGWSKSFLNRGIFINERNISFGSEKFDQL